MSPKHWRELEELYQAARDLPDGERTALLQKADPGLRAKVEDMLAQQGSALDRPAWQRSPIPAEGTEILVTSGARFGPYQLEQPIGAGGMGQVFRAIDTRLQRPVALKVPRQSFDSRFEREARVIAQLNHPHICTLYDVGPNYLVMELLEGETLAARIATGPLPTDEVIEIGSQIAAALSAAHAKGIIHRDLKPGNVMLTAHGVKVLDFGLAKLALMNDSLSAPGMVMGTPAYLAPEQVQGRVVDERADLFALGLILYETATGKLPYPGVSLGQILSSNQNVVAPPPSRVRTGLPARLDSLVSGLLSAQPGMRTSSAGQVLEQLKGIGGPKGASRRAWLAVPPALLATGAGVWLFLEHRSTPSLHVVNLQQIGPLSGDKKDPAFSPDGASIAFAWTGETGKDSGVYVMNRSNGQTRRVTVSPSSDISPAWSPDGTRIVYLRLHPGQASELMMIASNGGPERKIRDMRMPEILRRSRRPLIAWTHSGRGVIVPMEDPETGGASLFQIPMDGSGVTRRLVRADRTIGLSGIAPSPDGRWLAYTSFSDGIHVRRLVEGLPAQEEEQTFKERLIQSPIWSSDGRQLIFALGAQIVAWDVHKNTSSAIYISPYPIQAMTAWWKSAQVPELVFSIDGGQIEMYSLRLKDGSGNQGGPASLFLRAAEAPSISRDGEWVVYETNARGEREIWMANRQHQHPRQLTALGGSSRGRWSPDGRHIAFHGPDWQIYVLDVDPKAEIARAEGAKPTVSPRQLTHAGFQMAGPEWSADGNYIYASRLGTYRVVRVPVAGGDPEDLFEGNYPRVDPTRNRIYYGKSDQFGLFARSLDGDIRSNPEERVLADYVPPRGFDVGRKGIYYLGRDNARKPTAIRFFNFTSKTSVDLAPPPRGVIPSIAVSPDGSLLLYDTLSDTPGTLTAMQLRRGPD